jgi:hypothetical protein
MNRLILITHLKTQIVSEINRLEQTLFPNLEQEFQRYHIYEQLTHTILKNHV